LAKRSEKLVNRGELYALPYGLTNTNDASQVGEMKGWRLHMAATIKLQKE